ncbi:S8 family serine peptidase [Lentzea tibetensis]|uniref:S8 family serine peptidase n=1 Tax=Lentzea tibetensis TaxID=2591470 RepID=A0A563EGN7_9PSEU|nr:S8 family serine peptidase [Lentzea tibetensis]TWP45619.1 S8 family serine peptidase [Lentzea tibetensis]
MNKRMFAAGLAAAAVMSTAAVPATATGERNEVRADGLTTAVTLITGDQVSVVGGEVRTRPGTGRERMGFHRYTEVGGDLHVVPADAEQQVASGALDERLFNVSLLARSGYDDTSRDTIPLIVQSDLGVASGPSLASIGARAAKAPKNGEFWTQVRGMGTTKVWLDGKVTATLDRSAAQIGAPSAWEKGLTGAGVTVAVLDTGIDATHPDLAGAVVEAQNFTDTTTADDLSGHGTHVASTITGAGRYQGIAPDAKLVSGKVLGPQGGQESWIIAGMEWAATKAKVVNMSLGGGRPSSGDDPLSLALNRISAQTGALFVVSAGNSGGQVASPAAADAALTVGAVLRDDSLANFSSRGPRFKDNAIKPDITAPGVGIVAAKARNGTIGTPVDENHVAMDGTSMATPHVAGAAAILAAQHPAWTGQDIKAALMNSAKPNAANTFYEQGAGRVDVAKAVAAAVSANAGSLSLGRAAWPHGDDEPIIRKVTYRNSGSEPVTLDLKIDEQKPGAGVFSVSPAKLTVPAGGTAEAVVTADTRVNVPDGFYTAVVKSSDGTRIPLTVERQIESYPVKLSFVDGDGKPTPRYQYRLVNLDEGSEFSSRDQDGYDESGTITRTLPKGRYLLEMASFPASSGISWLIEPNVEVKGPQEFLLDHRTGTVPDLAVERQDASDGGAEVQFTTKASWGSFGSGFGLPGFADLCMHPSTTSAPEFEWSAEVLKARRDAGGTFNGSPFQYNLRMAEKGKVPRNLRRKVLDSELARVDSVTHVRVPGSLVRRNGGAFGPAPLRLREYYTPGVPWRTTLDEFDPVESWKLLGVQNSRPRTFKRGQHVAERWNTAVFGPSFPMDSLNADRSDTLLFLGVPMFSQNGDSIGNGVVGQETRSVLYRGDQVISESRKPGYAAVEVPDARDTYRFHVTGSRENSLTSKLDTTWTFTSERTNATIPLLALRFAPKLDEHNSAAAGRPLTIPVSVQRNGTPGYVTDVRTPEIQVSYDDGVTWQQTKAFRTAGRWSVTLHHPKDAKSVSFKAKTGDVAGSVEQTIIRAYDLK